MDGGKNRRVGVRVGLCLLFSVCERIFADSVSPDGAGYSRSSLDRTREWMVKWAVVVQREQDCCIHASCAFVGFLLQRLAGGIETRRCPPGPKVSITHKNRTGEIARCFVGIELVAN